MTEPPEPLAPADPSDRELAARLREAYAPGVGGSPCPPPAAFLEAAAGLLPEAEALALDRHAEECPACAAERELARLFHAAPEGAGAAAEDVDFVVERLRRASPAAAALPVPPPEAVAPVIPFPARRQPAPADRPALSRPRPVAWRLAAALFFVLAAGLAFRAWYPPGGPGVPLPPPELGGAMRGAEVQGLRPAGDLALAALPAELAWEPYPGARSYRVRLSAVDGETLWEATVAGPPARLPAAVLGGLHRAVLYRWRVEALGADGATLAASPAVEIRAVPAAEEGGR